MKITDTIKKAVKEYSFACFRVKTALKAKKVAYTKISEMLGNDYIIEDGGMTALEIEESEVSRFDLDSFKKDHPELYNEYIKTTEKSKVRLGKEWKKKEGLAG